VFQKKKESDTDSEASQSARRKRSKPQPAGNLSSGRSTPSKLARAELVRREGPKWDPARIGKDTVFVMGARYVVIVCL
jgi:deoxynucleotidyltransferase terminal-interacting protein 1